MRDTPFTCYTGHICPRAIHSEHLGRVADDAVSACFFAVPACRDPPARGAREVLSVNSDRQQGASSFELASVAYGKEIVKVLTPL